MIRHLTFTIFILSSLAGNTQNIADKWQFDNIRKVNDTTNLRVISNSDYMLINEDSTFEYEISSIALKASGEWELKENILRFHYDTPSDTSRFYSVELKKGTLVLNENDINYSFTSSKYLKPIQTGFDIMTILRGLLGIAVLIGIAFAFSRNRKGINWPLVWKGLLIQIIFAVAILKIPFIQSAFEWLSSIFVIILGFTRDGSLFLFGGLIDNMDSFGYIFAFQVLPTIVFFSALTSVLFYYGILQKVVYFFAVLMKKIMNLSGSESLAAIGNIFLGQTESPLLVKPYVEEMTLSRMRSHTFRA
jgi:CNT family concentrative nucleoside transporter